jgi:hypothetical protein
MHSTPHHAANNRPSNARTGTKLWLLPVCGSHLKELQLPWLAMHAQQLPVADEGGLAHLTADMPQKTHSRQAESQQTSSRHTADMPQKINKMVVHRSI